MLKLIMRLLFGKLKIQKKNLFYEIYKWEDALNFLVEIRYAVYAELICIISIIFAIFIKIEIISYGLIFIAIVFLISQFYEVKLSKIPNILGINTKYQKKGLKINENIRRIFSTTHGKVISRKDWKTIKEIDNGLYNILTTDLSNHCCYIYSLSAAVIVKDVNIIWCAISDPNKQDFCAHAIIEKNGFVFDTNRRRTYNLKDYADFYNLIIFKTWTYDEYSQTNFRSNLKESFSNWCIKNNVGYYELF